MTVGVTVEQDADRLLRRRTLLPVAAHREAEHDGHDDEGHDEPRVAWCRLLRPRLTVKAPPVFLM